MDPINVLVVDDDPSIVEMIRLGLETDGMKVLSAGDGAEALEVLAREPVDMNALLQEIAALLLGEWQARGVTLTVQVDARLPRIRGDEQMLRRAFMNLTLNACQAMPAGGRVTLAARGTLGGVELSVRDTGPGLPADDLPRIFDRFYRADDSRVRDEGGSGLGLAIAKSIVLAHGGQIRAESEEGKGLEVIITLPVTQD